jgi:hypothetical protein
MIERKYKKIFIIAFLTLLFFTNKFAQAEKINIALDRTIFSSNVDPGSNNEIKFNVSNLLSDSQNISIEAEDFFVGENNSILKTADKNENFGMKDWLLIPEKNHILGPGETKEIKIIVNVPKNASLGAHYAIINVQAFPEVDEQNSKKTIIGGQIGVYALFNVNGEVSGNGNLKSFKAPIIGRKEASFKAVFENTGNVFYIPHGEIQVKNLFTRKNTTIETEKHFVFPGSQYSFEIKWDSFPSSSFGLYSVKSVFVDANGVAHAKRGIVFGTLFFLISLIFLASLSVFLYLKIKKK